MHDEADYFTALKGRQFRFVKLHSDGVLLVWEKIKDNTGWDTERLGGLNIRQVGVDTLKSLGVWDKLSPDIQKQIIDQGVLRQVAIDEKMANARAGRRKKYVGIPKEIECTRCHKKITISPSIIMGRVEKIAKAKSIIFTAEDYIRDFNCQSCRPSRRGKQVNPEFASLPKVMICGCGKKVNVNPYQLKKKAEKNKTTMQELIKKFKCQGCEKTKGRHKRKAK